MLEGLGEDEPCLRHRAFEGVNQKQDAVGHFEDALDLAAEVGVAGSVDYIDFVFAAFGVRIVNRAIFAQDGDAAFPFEGV